MNLGIGITTEASSSRLHKRKEEIHAGQTGRIAPCHLERADSIPDLEEGKNRVYEDKNQPDGRDSWRGRR